MMGSTDIGHVNWVVPTLQARVRRTPSPGAPGSAAASCWPGRGGDGPAQRVMAGVAVDALDDPTLIERAKADHKARTDVTPSTLSAAGQRPVAPDPAALQAA